MENPPTQDDEPPAGPDILHPDPQQIRTTLEGLSTEEPGRYIKLDPPHD